MVEHIGYVASILLSLCGVPQAVKSVKDGETVGISKLFVWSWFLGEVGMIVYTLFAIGFNGPLLLNYCTNTIILIIILKYMYFPRRKHGI